jgi:hypothetical protein
VRPVLVQERFEGRSAAVGRLAAVVGRFKGAVDDGLVQSTASGVAAPRSRAL